MGGDWYSCEYFYGYEILPPKDMDIREFICLLAQINHNIKDQEIIIRSFIDNIYSNMDDLDELEMEKSSTFVIGFTPSDNLITTIGQANNLKEYIDKNNLSKNLILTDKAGFYCGMEVFQRLVDRHWLDYPQYFKKK